MKKYLKKLILIIPFLGTTFFTFAQSADYLQTMNGVVTNIQSAPFGADLTAYANQMEKIAAAEPKEWLPNYWAAYCYLMKTRAEQNADKKDLLLDKSDTFIANAEKIMPNNDEIEVLKANLASSRIMIDPQNRWQEYGEKSSKALGIAKGLNPENPRIYLLEAQSTFYTPEDFGGGKQKSLPIFKEAFDKFTKFKPSSEIMPNWGKSVAQHFIDEASK